MGQGTESINGYDVDYHWWDESDLWAGKYDVSKMTRSHLLNAIRTARDLAETATFSSDSDTFNEWQNILAAELMSRRNSEPTVTETPTEKKEVRGSKITLVCHCGTHYQARVADIKRGWAKSCSKRCAAIKRDFGRQNPTSPDGTKLKDILKNV